MLRETIKEQERKLEEQGKCLEIQKKEMIRMVESLQEVMSKVSHMSDLTCLSRRFAIDNISVIESRITPIHWKSPAMYTHQCQSFSLQITTVCVVFCFSNAPTT